MDDNEVVSRESFVRKVLYGRNIVSAFKMARGYTPAIVGLEKNPVSTEIISFDQEQVSRPPFSTSKAIENQSPSHYKELKKKRQYNN